MGIDETTSQRINLIVKIVPGTQLNKVDQMRSMCVQNFLYARTNHGYPMKHKPQQSVEQ